ncbi:MAG: OmpA family protein [Actinomycetota bacterium]|nr:OmpA family protein [Actinomycetota bacterium]
MSNSDETRSRVEQLIAIADRVASQEVPPAPPRRWLPLVVGLLGVAALTAGVLGLVDNTSGAPVDVSTTAAPQPTTAPVTVPATAVSPTTLPVTTLPSTTVPSTDAPTTVPATTVPPAVGAAVPNHWAEFVDGTVYLRGTVPDQASADQVRERAAAVFGADNVVVEYSFQPGIAHIADAPLYLRDWVTFEQNSATLDDANRGLLDVLRILMVQHPQVTIRIDGHTDSVGPDDSNLELSQARVDAIASYLQATGIDPARITRTAHGESAPIADNNTAEGRAENRRIEFTLEHLLA